MFLPVRNLPSAFLIINLLRNKLRKKVPTDISRNPPILSFCFILNGFTTVLTEYQNLQEIMTSFIISLSSLFESINIIVPETLVLEY